NPRVDYALGLHVAGSLPKGYVGIGRGEISASCDDFTITLHGRGGHGSQPSLCISPIQMGIDIIQSVQNFVYNCHADGDGVVLTFGQFQAGHNPNVIPETAELKGTLRTYDETKRHRILAALQAILENVTTTYGGTFDLDVVPFSPVCVNDDGVTDRVVHILQDHCADRVDLVPLKRGSGSEDFAYFSAAVPSSFYYVGVYSNEPVIGHSPEFHWDSNALKYMCETMLNIVYYFESYQ
ncbi:MAG: peptidase dimerization domain-containing protein, partial [Megasphaera elsdenii]|nr:peptidase dimerization domain-containing protein [Megasphaera elsdenii]